MPTKNAVYINPRGRPISSMRPARAMRLAAAMIEALLRDEPIDLCLKRGLAAAALTCESEDTVAPSMSIVALEQKIRSTNLHE